MKRFWKEWVVKSNKLFLVIFTIEILGCFLVQDVNLVAARFTSLLSFFALAFIAAKQLYVRYRHEQASLTGLLLTDREMMVAAAGSVIALLNLFLIGSNKGAFLTAADVLIMCFVARSFTLNEKERFYLTGLCSALLLWWYCTVRWYFNFNMTGIIFMLTAFMSMLLMEMLKKRYDGLSYLSFVQMIQYIVATLLCLLYHARCVLLGMLVFAVLYFLLPYISKSRLLGGLLVFSVTAGSLLFTLFYMFLDKTGVSITFLYKDILSGRQDIWSELWEAFLSQPLTGIGSSYHLRSFFIFEVHNGLFDILAVHGGLVFVCVMYLLCKRLYEALVSFDGTVYSRICLCAVFVVLFISFFENFFINSPYLLFVLFFLSKERGMRK